MQSIIVSTLYLLTSLIPLTFTTVNSELFEFPKFILLLSGSLIITVAWAIHIYRTHDWKIKLTPIDYSVLAILATQTIATIFSIHPYTSFWGYYSRFHQGLLSTLCYTIIYFAAVKWLDNKSTQKLIKISIGTAFLIGLYAIAQHFGIDKNLWIQDVQSRAFSTLGQPNWLASYLLPNLFLVLYLSRRNKTKSSPSIIVHGSLFIVFFLALLFTKSRSGFLAFVLSYVAYWAIAIRQFNFTKVKQSLLLYSGILILASLSFGTPFSPTLASMISRQPSTIAPAPSGTALETGGTESSSIRQIVWTGALKLIQKHPILGTGPETFAYTYYWERPTAHNLTSEWDFIYNKAHNEYLNIAAGAGLIGLLAYLYFHFAVFATSLSRIPKSKKVTESDQDTLRAIYPVIGASIVGFSVTNFFGFSVIPVYLLMILLAALCTSSAVAPEKCLQTRSGLGDTVYHPLLILLLIPIVLLYPARLFLADLAYARGKAYLDLSQPAAAIPLLETASSYRPSEALFASSLGEAYALLALGSKQSPYVDSALRQASRTRELNPVHLNYFKSRAKIYLTLATLDPKYNDNGAQELVAARALAPTDPKLAYNLALVYTRLNRAAEAEQNFRDAIALKPNYADPYYALILLFEQSKQTDKLPDLLSSARSHLATYSSLLKEKMDKYTSQ